MGGCCREKEKEKETNTGPKHSPTRTQACRTSQHIPSSKGDGARQHALDLGSWACGGGCGSYGGESMLQDEKCRVGGSVGRGAHATWSDASTDWGAGVPCHFEGGFPSPVRGPQYSVSRGHLSILILRHSHALGAGLLWSAREGRGRCGVVGYCSGGAQWTPVTWDCGPGGFGGRGGRCWRFLARRVSNIAWCSGLWSSRRERWFVHMVVVSVDRVRLMRLMLMCKL